MWRLDRDLQSFRAPGAPAAWYVFVPSRWQRRLYRPEAHPMIADAWKALALMYVTGWAGALLFTVGTAPDAPPVRTVEGSAPLVECREPASSSQYGAVLSPGQRVQREPCR